MLFNKICKVTIPFIILNNLEKFLGSRNNERIFTFHFTFVSFSSTTQVIHQPYDPTIQTVILSVHSKTEPQEEGLGVYI